jgi:hypothetical protein
MMGINIYLLPLAVAISLVYGASRYEDADRIWKKSLRTFVTIVVFMAVVLGILAFFSLWQ